jgi:sugar phosphate isomerase/epimerase
MPENFRRTHRTVGYALNVFPYRTLAELRACLAGDVLKVKADAFPGGTFPIELRLSENLLPELQADRDTLADVKRFLDANQLALVTINAFVMPAFHGEQVKERVYLPGWHESDARVQFTNACLDVLAVLAPQDTALVSVSVPFGALKPVTMAAVAPNILRCAEHAASLGRRCVVALEPEPGLCVETTDEVVEFFERFVPDKLRAHLGVNFDLSHQLVEFEDLAASVSSLQRHDVPIAKVHVSNAAEMTSLQPFYDDSIYLHQVCGVDDSGRRIYFSLDWPKTPPPAGIRRFRVHYHLPVFPSSLSSTLPEVERFLTSILPTIHSSTPAVIETYTWPEQNRNMAQLPGNIVRELNWVREKIFLSESARQI